MTAGMLLLSIDRKRWALLLKDITMATISRFPAVPFASASLQHTESCCCQILFMLTAGLHVYASGCVIGAESSQRQAAPSPSAHSTS
jgi:hypothetical protein